MNGNVSIYDEIDLEGFKITRDGNDCERKNLLLSLPQNIKNYENIIEERRTEWFNSPAACTRLTDGVYASEANCFDEACFHFTDGCARSIIYDLGAVCAVDGAQIGVLKEDSTAVRPPVRVCVLLSENGNDWQTVCEISGFSSEKENDIIRKSVDFSKKYRARYVKFTFCIVCHVWIDQLELFGTECASGASGITPDTVNDTDFPDRYASYDRLGAKDVLLAYFCHERISPITKEIFLPHVAYIENGEIKDTLFDGYLFLPYVAFLYEGYKKRPLQKKDWQHYIDTQFIDGFNMDALDEAAKEVGKALDIKDFKVSVYMSILYPVTEVREFGEVNGKKLDFALLEDRKSALQWLIDEQYARFTAKKYKHLDLKGFYWFTEEINYADEQLLSLLRFTTDHVRELGLITTWIPYYHASGYNDWRHLGFDLVCYQPNYAFNQSVPDSRLFDAASTAKLMGMCIELEVGGTADWNIERIKKYYAAGAITGYMKEAAHMYYQDGVPGIYYAAYKSKDENLHSVYNDTYRFIKGTFKADEIEFGGNNNA